VHEVVAAEQLDAKVHEIAGALVTAGPEAVKATKQLVQDVAGHEITHGLINRTAEAIADVRVSDEGREGIRSFLEKRKPDWLLPKG
jgi:methylglutaconyl-CoA hydratase